MYWHCYYCGNDIPAEAHGCPTCGRGTSRLAYVHMCGVIGGLVGSFIGFWRHMTFPAPWQAVSRVSCSSRSPPVWRFGPEDPCERKRRSMLTIRTILHATDFSEDSNHAFRLAYTLASDHGARLIVADVIPGSAAPAGGVMTPPPSEEGETGAQQLGKSGAAIPRCALDPQTAVRRPRRRNMPARTGYQSRDDCHGHAGRSAAPPPRRQRRREGRSPGSLSRC